MVAVTKHTETCQLNQLKWRLTTEDSSWQSMLWFWGCPGLMLPGSMTADTNLAEGVFRCQVLVWQGKVICYRSGKFIIYSSRSL